MVDSRCHSFEDISSTRKHHASLTCSSRSESSQDTGSTRLTECFATINLSFQELQNASQTSLTRPRVEVRSDNPHLQLQENRSIHYGSPERGRSRARASPTTDAHRASFRSPTSPDRFIPKREYIDQPSTPFRVNKHPHLLSPRERFLRRRVPGHDPFLPSVRRPPTFPGQKSIPTRLRQRPHQRPGLVTASMIMEGDDRTDFLRVVSSGSVWGVGGNPALPSESSMAMTNRSRDARGRGTTAPNFVARFLPTRTAADDQNSHECRLALAFDIDPAARLLGTSMPLMENRINPSLGDHERFAPFVWKDNSWKKAEQDHWPATRVKREVVPPKPFRILDAPYLRDDFYCSTLAYSLTSGILAVGLGQFVYLWSEGIQVDHPPFGDVHPSNYVTCLSFSSENGGRSILAVGRQSGQLTLWGVSETKVRFELSHPNSISCVAFKPRTTRRNSERFPTLEVDVEELAVGDEMGNIWYYSVEWPVVQNKWSWTGSMTLLAKITAHTQQVCGLAWSPDERYLATGGNDNACLLFELQDIIPASILNRSAYTPVSTSSSESPNDMTFHAFPCINLTTRPGRLRLFNREHIVNHLLPSWAHTPPTIRVSAASPVLSNLGTLISGLGKTVIIPADRQKYRLLHGAAVKAIAFAPWQPSLLATGGGSNDRAIHFFHSRTGVCLATINVFAQVTSLIWSQNRREIAATFGYAQPEHPFRIAVFAWPSCAQVAVIPWGPYGSSWDASDRDVGFNCGRALWAVGYPGRKCRRSSTKKGDGSAVGERPSSSSASPTTTSSSDRSQSQSSASRSPRSARGDETVRPKEKEGGMWCTRTIEEGCIIVASSDQTVKFHEIWTGRRTSVGSASELFGGSDILESMEGIEKSGSEVIR